MRVQRLMPLIYMLFGAFIAVCLFFSFHYQETRLGDELHNHEDIRRFIPMDTTVRNLRMDTTVGNLRQDCELLMNCVAEVDIPHLEKLYSRKMKYLADKNLIRTMGKRPNCTKKLLESKPGVWCHDLTCKQKLPPTGSPDVFNSIAKPLKAVRSDTYRRIQEVFGAHTLPKRKYVFLLAISENHYLESMATIRSLHTFVFPHISNFTFYVYDMGITRQQIKMLDTYGRCTVRKYPFDKFPDRLHAMKTYTWKPVLIQAHIEVGEFVVYMDASVRFKTDLSPLFKTLSHTGFLMTRGFHALALQTSKSMFSYFGDHACSYASYVEFEGAFIAIHNEEFSRKLLLEPWVACAIDPLCMAQGSLNCAGDRKYGKCHRFDLSAMTLMLVKLFREEHWTFASPRSTYHYVKQGRTNVSNYLEEFQNKTLRT